MDFFNQLKNLEREKHRFVYPAIDIARLICIKMHFTLHEYSKFKLQVLFLATDFCNPNPCLHNGVCVIQESGYKCRCPPQFIGHNCEGMPPNR